MSSSLKLSAAPATDGFTDLRQVSHWCGCAVMLDNISPAPKIDNWDSRQNPDTKEKWARHFCLTH